MSLFRGLTCLSVFSPSLQPQTSGDATRGSTAAWVTSVAGPSRHRLRPGRPPSPAPPRNDLSPAGAPARAPTRRVRCSARQRMQLPAAGGRAAGRLCAADDLPPRRRTGCADVHPAVAPPGGGAARMHVCGHATGRTLRGQTRARHRRFGGARLLQLGQRHSARSLPGRRAAAATRRQRPRRPTTSQRSAGVV